MSSYALDLGTEELVTDLIDMKTEPDLHFLSGGGSRPWRGLRVTKPTLVV
jgi:hypothetical protein